VTFIENDLTAVEKGLAENELRSCSQTQQTWFGVSMKWKWRCFRVTTTICISLSALHAMQVSVTTDGGEGLQIGSARG
jgi:hypothetical protein